MNEAYNYLYGKNYTLIRNWYFQNCQIIVKLRDLNWNNKWALDQFEHFFKFIFRSVWTFLNAAFLSTNVPQILTSDNPFQTYSPYMMKDYFLS